MNKKFIGLTAIVAGIIEVILWILDAVQIIWLFGEMVAREFMDQLISKIFEGTLTLNGISLNPAGGTLEVFFAFLVSIIGLSLSALICRNIYKIFKSEIPFCERNIRLVRNIGIFSIAIPLSKLVLGIIVLCTHLNQYMSFDGGVRNPSPFFFGLVVLALSQFFKYGTSLEKDVDGLL